MDSNFVREIPFISSATSVIAEHSALFLGVIVVLFIVIIWLVYKSAAKEHYQDIQNHVIRSERFADSNSGMTTPGAPLISAATFDASADDDANYADMVCQQALADNEPDAENFTDSQLIKMGGGREGFTDEQLLHMGSGKR